MKKTILLLSVVGAICLVSCRVKYGCPSSGRNMGAEKLLSGDKLAMKQAKRAGKFRN